MAIAAPRTTQEHELLAAARGGDEEAFRRIVEEHRAALHAHCYRMLGSLHDADDALQETLLRAWRGLAGFGGRSSLRSWLYKIATNACLDAIERRPKRVLPIDYGPPSEPSADPGEPLVESVWVEPYPDEAIGLDDGRATPEARYELREAIELAFVAVLQHLPATQRAVLIQRDVLGFSAREVAESLQTTVASVNSALQRARKTVDERLPSRASRRRCTPSATNGSASSSRPTSMRGPRGDVDAVRALLAEDAVFSMPPWAAWWRGRDTIGGFAKEAVEFCAASLPVSTQANGQPAIAYYHLDAETGRYKATAIDVISFEGALIKEVTAFVTSDAFSRFGLPAELACAVPA